MKVIVCEDDSIYRKSICDKIEMWKKKTAHNDVHICEFLSSEDMLEQWENGLRADLIFLDIHFHNELDGIEIAKQIRLADEGVPLVFITNYESFWREGYTVYALRYLSKPVAYDDIAPCLDIAYRRMQSMNANFFVINESGKRFAYMISEILYIEAQSPYLNIVTTDPQKKICIRRSLSDIVNEMDKSLFIQCHRSYIVNIMHIRAIVRTQVVLSDNTMLPLSKRHMTDVYKAFDDYYQGRYI